MVAKKNGYEACVDLYVECMRNLWARKPQEGLSEKQIQYQATQLAEELNLNLF